MLGLAMVILGVNILGNMNKESMSAKNLGLAFWRIVLGSAIIVLVLGVFNIVAVRLLFSCFTPSPLLNKADLIQSTELCLPR